MDGCLIRNHDKTKYKFQGRLTVTRNTAITNLNGGSRHMPPTLLTAELPVLPFKEH